MRINKTLPLLLLSAALACAPAFAAKKTKPPTKKPLVVAPLPARIDAALDGVDGQWGVLVHSLEDGSELYARNADQRFAPASNVKLFTVTSALELLGDEARAQTTVECSPSALNGALIDGDLVLVGRGDASLSSRDLDKLAEQTAARGVRQVSGAVIGDDGWLGWEQVNDSWLVGDLVWDYGAQVSALSVDDNSMQLRLAPGAQPGDAASVELLPIRSLYKIENHVRTADATHDKKELSLHRDPGSRVIEVWGWLPPGDKETILRVAAADPSELAASIFAEALRAHGVEVAGGARARHASRAEASMQTGDRAQYAPIVLASHAGPTTLEEARTADKMSQNLHAELLLRRMGRTAAGPGPEGALAAGLNAEKAVFAKAGVAEKEIALADGSGLARGDMATPNAIVKLLEWAVRQKWGGAFVDTLPIAGVDGTLAHRAQATGEVRAKTGSFQHVNALSGYATTASGARVVFSIIVNNHLLGARGGSEAIDKIVAAIVDDRAPQTKEGRAAAQPSQKPAPKRRARR